MSNDGLRIVFVFFHKFFGSRESNLVDILFDFVGCHPDTTVADGDGAFLFVNRHVYGQVAQLAFEFANGCQGFQLLCSVYGVRY